MNNVRIINDEYLKEIASTVRRLQHSENKYTATEMAENILNSDFGIMFNSDWGGAIINDGLSLPNKYASNVQEFFPIIGYGVTNCYRTFFNCRNAIGEPIVKSNLIDSMGETFADCWRITGAPQCGTHVTNLTKAYYNCVSLDGEMKAFDPTFINVKLAAQAFYNDSNLHGNAVYLENATNLYQTYWHCSALDGNGYIGENVTDARGAFSDCYNLKGAMIIGSDRTPSKLVSMQNAYRNCYNIINVLGTYGDYKINLSAVTNMDNAFANCYNMKGIPYVSPLVSGVGLMNAYYECQNIYGAPMFSPLATDGQNMYYNCGNLTGMMNEETYGKIARVDHMFYNCHNIHGSMFFPATATNIVNAFRNCSKLGGLYFACTNASLLKAVNMANAFVRPKGSDRLNIVFAAFKVFDVARVNSVTGCDMSTAEINNGMIVNLPYCYNNGKIYGFTNKVCNRISYNEEYNIYMYSMT